MAPRTTYPLSAAGRRQLARLIELFHRRWAVPILAFLWGDLEQGGPGGAKFITVHHTLGINRESLAATLDHLITIGYVRRNTGYGHPMRPEYILTPRGRRCSPACQRLLIAAESQGAAEVFARKWSAPVIFAMGSNACRFSELAEIIPDQTNRALAIALKQLEGASLLTREVTHDFPPTSWYRLTKSGLELARILRDL